MAESLGVAAGGLVGFDGGVLALAAALAAFESELRADLGVEVIEHGRHANAGGDPASPSLPAAVALGLAAGHAVESRDRGSLPPVGEFAHVVAVSGEDRDVDVRRAFVHVQSRVEDRRVWEVPPHPRHRASTGGCSASR